MMTAIFLLLLLIFLLLVAAFVFAYLGWMQVSTYLTWNTRYESSQYEQAITTTKSKHPESKPSVTEQRGRSVKAVDDLVDLGDLDFETAISAVEALGQ